MKRYRSLALMGLALACVAISMSLYFRAEDKRNIRNAELQKEAKQGLFIVYPLPEDNDWYPEDYAGHALLVLGFSSFILGVWSKKVLEVESPKFLEPNRNKIRYIR